MSLTPDPMNAIGELEPCPFCGEGLVDFIGYGSGVYAVACHGCGAQTKFHRRKRDAAEAWNRRARSSPQVNGDVVEAVKRARGVLLHPLPEHLDERGHLNATGTLAAADALLAVTSELIKPDGSAALSKAEAHLEGEEGVDEPNDAQRALVLDLITGRACSECAEPIEPGQPCEACADKRELLRQAFPKLHGDA